MSMNDQRRNVLTGVSKDITEIRKTLEKKSKVIRVCQNDEETYLDKMNPNTKVKFEKAEEAVETLGYIQDQLKMIDGLLKDVQDQIENAKA